MAITGILAGAIKGWPTDTLNAYRVAALEPSECIGGSLGLRFMNSKSHVRLFYVQNQMRLLLPEEMLITASQPPQQVPKKVTPPVSVSTHHLIMRIDRDIPPLCYFLFHD
ncbi:XRE family transcriptional regulator [Sesbania bispinosa]|nr:XRE family transcriptional regulator [Sesbania bispinosa]